MPISVYETSFPRLSPDALEAWSRIPASIASDCLGRGQTMAAAISPLAPTMRITAQALTVACMAADNSAIHAAMARCPAGDVLVCDGQGFEDAALFGELMTRDCENRGIAGIVLDGAVRDWRDVVEAGFPCFARATVPRGPHKGFGGTVGATISCGGVAVAPGDLVIGDSDGVTIVPLVRAEEALAAAHEAVAREKRVLKGLADGGSLAEVYGAPDVTVVGTK
jgi:4-hydroxy-4-methyl-2-oxoglutarate aldolase